VPALRSTSVSTRLPFLFPKHWARFLKWSYPVLGPFPSRSENKLCLEEFSSSFCFFALLYLRFFPNPHRGCPLATVSFPPFCQFSASGTPACLVFFFFPPFYLSIMCDLDISFFFCNRPSFSESGSSYRLRRPVWVFFFLFLFYDLMGRVVPQRIFFFFFPGSFFVLLLTGGFVPFSRLFFLQKLPTALWRTTFFSFPFVSLQLTPFFFYVPQLFFSEFLT